MRYIQRCKQRQLDIYKDVNKANEIYTKMQTKTMRYIQRCKQRQWDMYKDVNKGNGVYTLPLFKM